MAAVVNIKLAFQNSNFRLDKCKHGGANFPLDLLVHKDDQGCVGKSNKSGMILWNFPYQNIWRHKSTIWNGVSVTEIEFSLKMI